MKHNRTPWSLLAALVIMVMLLAACGGAAPAAPTAAPVKEAPKAAEPTKAPAAVEPTKASAAAAPAAGKVAPGSVWNKDDYEKAAGVTIAKYGESPLLAEQVKAGKLPPVEQRLPKNPVVVQPWMEVGQYGGNVRWDEYTIDYDHYFRHIQNIYLLGRNLAEDTYYNSGLAGEIRPMIFEKWESNPTATEYTLKLREGLKWSDGKEVTTEDIRYRFEDELSNTEITANAPTWMRWNPEKKGITTKLQVVDKYTVKITFAMPYGAFLQQVLRSGSWPALLSPSHYTRQFHKKYTDIAKIMPLMEQQKMTKAEEWPNFYNKVQAGVLGDAGGWLKHPYPKDIPVLYPWIVKEIKPDTSWVMERNPYFFQVDSAGNQLPYIDQLNRQYIAQSELMNLDIIAGKVDIQGQFLRIDDYPLFKDNEAKGNYNAIPVAAWQHHVLIYWLNPPLKDEKWSKALSNIEFRKALSIALDRKQINEAVFKGLGTPAQFAAPKSSPLYDASLSQFAAEYNPKEAAAILDKLGYKDTNGDKVREFPGGGDMVLPMLFYEVTPAAVPGVKMATQYWGDIGIKVDSKLLQGTAFWNFQGANEVPMSVWWANGPDFGDGAFVGMNVNTPIWRKWYNTQGKEGVDPPAFVKRIWEIQDERVKVATAEERMKLDKEGWKILVEQLMIIGAVEDAKNPLILSKSFGNAEYGFKKAFVGPSYMEGVVQFFHKDPARRK